MEYKNILNGKFNEYNINNKYLEEYNNFGVKKFKLNHERTNKTNEETLEILRESRNRIGSMAIIHESLYQTEDFSSIKFGEYLQNLVSNLVVSYRIIENIELEMDVSNVDLTKMGFEQNNFPVNKKLEYSALTPNEVSRISIKDGRGTFGVSFDKDIDIISLMDNLDRPVTELFITIINKGYIGYFNKPPATQPTKGLEVGWSFNFLENSVDNWWSKINNNNKDNIDVDFYDRTGDNGLNVRFYYNKDLPIGTELKGDICEWNEFDQKETVLSPISHKFSFNSDFFETNANVNLPDGYTYNPHHSVKLRVYSDYIEVGDKNDVSGVPDYSFFSNYEQQWRWRDIYSYGFVDSSGNGVNYPFLNGEHYPFADVLFLQTPLMKNNNVFNNIIFQPIIDNCE